MIFELRAWRHCYGLTQQRVAWLLGSSISVVRRLEADIGQLEAGDIAWLHDYAKVRDHLTDTPEVRVRVGRWYFLVDQAVGTLRPADAAAARALRGVGTRKLDRSTVELALCFDFAQPGIGWLWLHADGRPTRHNPAFPPCWPVVRPADPHAWAGWPALADDDHFCPDASDQ